MNRKVKKNIYSDIWFTSDTHFGHTNIIRYCNRPFNNIQQHDEQIIANWNAVVGPNDTVYHLGDFSLGRRPDLIARRLNGNKHLIRGNHDSSNSIRLIMPHFNWIKDYYTLKVRGQKFILFHYPIRNWHHCYNGAIHLFGHSHGGTEDYGKSTDVGVDCWNYFPVHIDVIVKHVENKNLISHHK